MDPESFVTGHLWVRPESWESLFVLTIGGELDLMTADQFSREAVKALHESRGPVLLDLHDLRFIDGVGAQTLARVMHTVPTSRAIEVHGCQQTVCRVLDLLGLELERGAGCGPDHSPDEHRALSGENVPRLLGPALRAQAREARSRSQEAASYASVVMAQLATTFENLACNSCCRAHDSGRLRQLGERARGMSARYQQYASKGN